MVSYFAGLCELCGAAESLATPEQCRAAGLDLDAVVCVECLRRLNPAAFDTIAVGPVMLQDADVMACAPLVPPTRKPS